MIIFSFVYKELKKIAASYLSRERVNHTLYPTALVHDACIKFVDQESHQLAESVAFYQASDDNYAPILD